MHKSVYSVEQKKLMNKIRLGIDIGGVVISKDSEEGEETSFFSEDYLKTPPEPFVLDSIQKLISILGIDNVFLVSKCGQNFRKKTLEWLDYVGFFSKTKMPRENVRFCDERFQKAIICNEIGITHFVDDRLDVLKHLIGVETIQELYLYKPNDIKKQGQYLYFAPFITKVFQWDSLTLQILNSHS